MNLFLTEYFVRTTQVDNASKPMYNKAIEQLQCPGCLFNLVSLLSCNMTFSRHQSALQLQYKVMNDCTRTVMLQMGSVLNNSLGRIGPCFTNPFELNMKQCYSTKRDLISNKVCPMISTTDSSLIRPASDMTTKVQHNSTEVLIMMNQLYHHHHHPRLYSHFSITDVALAMILLHFPC